LKLDLAVVVQEDLVSGAYHVDLPPIPHSIPPLKQRRFSDGVSILLLGI